MSGSIAAQFSRRLRTLRKESGLTQDALADLSGLHVTYIAGLEGGKRNPTLITLTRLATALGVSLSGLFEGVDENAGGSSPCE